MAEESDQIVVGTLPQPARTSTWWFACVHQHLCEIGSVKSICHDRKHGQFQTRKLSYCLSENKQV